MLTLFKGLGVFHPLSKNCEILFQFHQSSENMIFYNSEQGARNFNKQDDDKHTLHTFQFVSVQYVKY